MARTVYVVHQPSYPVLQVHVTSWKEAVGDSPFLRVSKLQVPLPEQSHIRMLTVSEGARPPIPSLPLNLRN